jgi:serine O-acetyltransferase
MNPDFLKHLYDAHQACTKCPPIKVITRFFEDLLGVLFPAFVSRPVGEYAEFETRVRALEGELDAILYRNLLDEQIDPRQVIASFFAAVPDLYRRLQEDVDAMFAGDPAAHNREEVVRAYPGFYAIAAYRVAHLLLNLGVANIPRMITEHAHSRTGIDIHPAAQIGDHFCIDHGTGIVIGETTQIGSFVKLYQGVTLGALSVRKSDARQKRHPTIEDHVVIYAGATILGGQTVIGHRSVIGGNVWLTKSVPPNSRVYYRAQMQSGENQMSDQIEVR